MHRPMTKPKPTHLKRHEMATKQMTEKKGRRNNI